jgi:hypothetical protein
MGSVSVSAPLPADCCPQNLRSTSLADFLLLKAIGLRHWESLHEALSGAEPCARLDIGCVAAHSMFLCYAEGFHTIALQCKAATAFLFELIARLQSSATVPMIDIRAYAKWLAK